MAYLLEGRRSDIAKLLHVSENTAKVHVRNVLRFYDAKDQLELVCKFRAGDGRDVA